MPRSKNGALLSLRNRGNTIVSSVLLVGLLGVVATVLVEDQFVVPADVKVAQVAQAANGGIPYTTNDSCTVIKTTYSSRGTPTTKEFGKFCTPTSFLSMDAGLQVENNCKPAENVPAGRCWVKVCEPSSEGKNCKVINQPAPPDGKWTIFSSDKAYNDYISQAEKVPTADANPNINNLVGDTQLSQALGCAFGFGCPDSPVQGFDSTVQPTSFPPVQDLNGEGGTGSINAPPTPNPSDCSGPNCAPDGGFGSFCPPGQSWTGSACAGTGIIPGSDQPGVSDYCKNNPTACQQTPPPQVPPPQVPPPQVPPPQEPPPQNQNNQNPFGNFAQMLGQLLGKALTGNNCPAGQAPSPYPQQQQQYVYQQNAFGQVVAVPVQQQQNTGFFGNLGNLFGGGSSNCAPQPGTAGGGTQQPQLPVQAQLSCSPKKAGVGSRIALTFACVNAQQGTGGGFSTGGALSGSTEVTIATSTLDADGNSKTYELSCTGATGIQRATCEVGVVVNPTIVLAAIPKEVKSGETSSIGWLATGMSACKVSSPQLLEFTTANENISLTEGIAKTTAISTTTDVFLKCTTLGGAAKESKVTITVTN